MGRIILTLILLTALTRAVQPVPKSEGKKERPIIKIQVPENDEDNGNKKLVEIKIKEPQDVKNDHFIDNDSNNINDKREDDLFKIKQLKIKFKDIFKKDKKEAAEEPRKPEKQIR